MALIIPIGNPQALLNSIYTAIDNNSITTWGYWDKDGRRYLTHTAPMESEGLASRCSLFGGVKVWPYQGRGYYRIGRNLCSIPRSIYRNAFGSLRQQL
jgi:hypothetical protein